MKNSRKKKFILLTTASLVFALFLAVGFAGCQFLEAKSIQTNVIRLETTKTKPKDIYNVKYQKGLHKQLVQWKDKGDYSDKSMLLIYNPYQLNVQSMYVHFQTKKPAKVSYRIHVEDTKIKDFTKKLANGAKKAYVTEHEYQVIGLVPAVENTITFYIEYENGKVTERIVQFTPDALTGTEKQNLSYKDGTSKKKLSDGLYVVLAENKFLYYYDNEGRIRSEIPILGYRAVNLLISQDNRMYYSINRTQIAEMNRFGQVTNLYSTGKYELHHDFTFDERGNLLILGTDPFAHSMEDRILKLDLKTGKCKQIIDLKDNFPDYYKKNKNNKKPDGEYDWMHLNTIQYVGNNSIIVSAREASAIIKISNIYKKPKVEYMLSEESFWKGTGYKKLLFEKASDFRSQTGQHTVMFEEDEKPNDGKYYLHMFNNNIGKSYSRPDYDWNANFDEITDVGTKGYRSFYYLYYVDENTRTYDLVKSYEVEYSGYVSSTQHYEGNHVVDSGQAFVFVENDSSGKLIRRFELTKEGKYCYRVLKNGFHGFLFEK